MRDEKTSVHELQAPAQILPIAVSVVSVVSENVSHFGERWVPPKDLLYYSHSDSYSLARRQFISVEFCFSSVRFGFRFFPSSVIYLY